MGSPTWLCHKLGILHRDLKPGNVFIRSNGDAVVGDFGIARLGDGDNTTTNQIVASVAYVAPEILDGAAPSPAADIYGIGVTLATALLGRSPFSSSESYTASSVIQRVISGHHEPLMTQGVSPSFSSVLEHTLSVDPTRRPSSADELQQLLISDLSTPPPLSQPLSPTQPLPSTTDATVQNLAPSSGSQQTSPVKASSNTTLVGILMVGTLLVVTAGLGLFLALGGEEAQSTSISSTTETGSINSTTVPNTTSADVLSPSTTPSDVASTTTSVTTNAEEPTTVKQPADPTDNQRIDATQVTANVEVRVFERVRFAQGTSSASAEGAVIRAERDVYILEAQAGQTMLIELASTADNALFTLVAPDNTIATTEAVQEQITLPLNGDYKVVIAPSPGNAEYNVSFTIE